MAAKLKTVTLGCKVNQYETQYVREGLVAVGYEDAAPDEPAQLCVVNTCTVTSDGDSKSRRLIRRLARENPNSRIVVMGCYATRAPDEIAALPGVAEVVTDKRELPDLLGRFGVVDIPSGISQFANRHRVYVKVQDGCLLRCSYCIIPLVRPVMTSRPMQQILDEIKRLVAGGYRELVLTGVHLGHYGVDGNWKLPKPAWTRLADLVRSIVAMEGDFRIRLSSIEATEVTRELIAVLKEHPDRICPHLHICMQSGSDTVLRRMKRRWGARRFLDRCRLVQQLLDQPALTTDVIVGFPGETDAEFEATCNVLHEVGFSKIHIFPFSSRRGTPAVDYHAQICQRIKTSRSRQVARIEQQLRQNYLESLLGRRLQVLVEGVDPNRPEMVVGTSCRYTQTAFRGHRSLEGSLVEVTAIAVENGRIHAVAS